MAKISAINDKASFTQNTSKSFPSFSSNAGQVSADDSREYLMLLYHCCTNFYGYQQRRHKDSENKKTSLRNAPQVFKLHVIYMFAYT